MGETVSLEELGWDPALGSHIPEGQVPGRVSAQHRGQYQAFTAEGEISASPSGRLQHEAGSGDLPAVGDWVSLEVPSGNSRTTIHAVLPRRSKLSRKQAGIRSAEQVLAANVDTAFVVMPVTGVRPRGVERYFTMAWDGGVEPVLVLTKSDLASDPDTAAADLRELAANVAVHTTSAVTGAGIDDLRAYLTGYRTAAILGPSGAGKSTLVNSLAGADLLETQEIRRDGRGRHTTVHRELLILPGGGMVIDTPGLRELQLWDAPSGLAETYEDIEALAASCRFSDCAHEREPGCSVREAVEQGTLSAARLEGFRKLERELEFLERRQRGKPENPKRRFKEISKSARRRRDSEW